MKRYLLSLSIVAAMFSAAAAQASDIVIAHIHSISGPLEAYGKQSTTGFMMGLEYATNGTMKVAGRKIVVVEKDDQGKPDLGKSLLQAAYADDKADIAVGPTSSGVALAMLPVAEEAKKILLVEPAVADSITGDKWNRYIFRTGRSSSQDAYAGAVAFPKGQKVSIATLAQDYAFGKDGIATFKQALAETRPDVTVVHEEYLPLSTTDFTAGAQRLFDALKDKPGRKIIAIVWAGPHPLTKIAALQPERFGIELAPGGNIIPVMQTWKDFPGLQGSIYYYYDFPKNKMNDWLVKEHQRRYNRPPDFFTAGGMAAAAAVVEALKKTNGDTNTEKLIKAMEGMSFETPKGKMTLRKEDHQAMQDMYVFQIKKDWANEFDMLQLVRTISASEMPIPIRNMKQ